MTDIPRFVPLPEVGEYTDAITIGELGLPVGFETDQLELNIAGLVHASRWGNIGHLSIVGFRGEKSEISVGVSGMSSDGSATASRSLAVSRAALHAHELSNDHLAPIGYRWKRAALQVNNAEIEQRIKQDGDKWDKGVYDPRARAHYMNRALKRGLLSASKDSIKDDNQETIAAISYSLWSTMDVAMGDSLTKTVGLNLFVGGLLNGLNHTVESKVAHVDVPRQWSLLYRVFYDRLAMSGIRTATTRLVRANIGTTTS